MSAGAASANVWIDAVIDRHRHGLTPREFLKAVRALSVRYVERRGALPQRAPADSAGKRAAFAGFFAPLHFLTARAVVRATGLSRGSLDAIVDLGCGTGVTGAAWALGLEQDDPPHLLGVDRQRWALEEAAWNWRQLGLHGRTRHANLVAVAEALAAGDTRIARGRFGVSLGWSVNELDTAARARLLPALVALAMRGVPLLIVEPVARSITPWWDEWARVLEPAGAHAGVWTFDVDLLPALAALDEAAGFQREGLRARVIYRLQD